MASTNFDKTAMMNQAQHIWSMLDDMAVSDPAAYKKFIDKHIKEGKEEMAPPKPHMCVLTTIQDALSSPIFINFFGWHRIPEPKSPEDAVPVMGSIMEEERKPPGKSYYIASVAFNPKILEEFGREAKNPIDRDTLVNLAIDYIEEMNQIKCSHSFTRLPKDQQYKGILENLQKSFLKKTTHKDKEFNDKFDELSKTFGPLSGVSNGNLLEQLANIAVDDTSKENNGLVSHEPEIRLSETKAANPGLIQEISSEITEKKLCPLKVPHYEIEKSWNDNHEGQCCIKITLPEVSSVSECELDISEDELSLFVEDKYKLKLKLVDRIDDEKSAAKFIKKTKCLNINMPIIKK